MHLDPFTLHRPTSLKEALDRAEALPGQFDFLAGGTDLLPNYKMHLNLRPHLISLDGVPELSGCADGRIGAMTRLADLESDPEFVRDYPGVAEAVRSVATPLVRAGGTVGGNLLVETRCFFFNQSRLWRASLGYCLKAEGDRCHVVPQKERCYATFSGDLAPTLLVLGATAEIAGPDGTRRVPLTDLYDDRGDGIHRTRLRPGEILVAVHIPPEGRRARASYRKLRIRPSFDFPEVGIAAALFGSPEQVERLTLAAGGLESYPRRFDALTDPIAGGPLDAAVIERLAGEVQKAVRPVHNTSLDAAYRKRMVGVFTRRAVTALRNPSGGAEA
ncbi:MAG: FAD binding domain-containing protein [Thermoplasmata archaeon]